MAPSKCNEFWKLRLKHGRDRIVEDPQSLWEDAQEYFQWCIDNPLMETDYRGKDVEQVLIPHMRVFQKVGLALACGLAKWESIEQLKDVSNDFLEVVTRIEGIIATQKFEGAAGDFLNARIIAQDLGLNVQRLVVDTQRKTIDELFPPEDDLNEQTAN